MTPLDVARAALTEAGRPDLAQLVRPNPRGWPAIPLAARNYDDDDVIIRALWMAHIWTGHRDAYIDHHRTIECRDCEPRMPDIRECVW